MKSLRNKNIWGVAAFGFVCVHFGLIFNYAMPPNYDSDTLERISKPYVEPIFTQRWSMFAPCPTINATVEMKFYFEKDSTAWFKPSDQFLTKHQWLRGSHHGELVIGESNLVYWLQIDLKEMGLTKLNKIPDNRLDEFKNGQSYAKISAYLKGYAQYLFKKNAKAARIRFEMQDVQKGEFQKLELPVFGSI